VQEEDDTVADEREDAASLNTNLVQMARSFQPLRVKKSERDLSGDESLQMSKS